MRQRFRLLRFVPCLAMGIALAFGVASASAAAPVESPTLQRQIEQLNRANAAVVGLRVAVAEDASSAETLGGLRAGSGVVWVRAAVPRVFRRRSKFRLESETARIESTTRPAVGASTTSGGITRRVWPTCAACTAGTARRCKPEADDAPAQSP